MRRAALRALIAFAAVSSALPAALGAPLPGQASAQRISVKVKRVKGSGNLMQQGIKAEVVSTGLRWEYIGGTNVSVPYIAIRFDNIPVGDNITVLVARSSQLPRDKTRGYILKLPLLRKSNRLSLTIVSADGQFEDWDVEVLVSFRESVIYVDETCGDYHMKIREVARPVGPNLMYVGCRAGSNPADLNLDILWGDISQIEYRSKLIPMADSVVTVPLDISKGDVVSDRFMGIHAAGEGTRSGKSVYAIEYVPFVPPPFELWAGLAFYRTVFEQSNFGSKFNQISSAFLGQLWIRPEGAPLSIMLRGFGSLASFSNNLEPDAGYEESVQTYFVNGEIRFKLLDTGSFRIDPFAGGWVYFMNVGSRNFGIQRIINPILGFALQKEMGSRNLLILTARFVPLQSYFNPLQFRLPQSYLELELTYAHAFQRRNRIFGTLYWGNMQYAPEGGATTNGSFLVIGGGYGW